MTNSEEDRVRHLSTPINLGTFRPASCISPNEKQFWAKEFLLEDEEEDNEKKGSRYIDCRFVLQSSLICDRFFSLTEYSINDRLKGTQPQEIERHLFLNMNSRFWDMNDVRVMQQ